MPALTSRRLVTVEARRPDLRFPLPRGFVRRLTGRRVRAVDRRAKYLLIRLDGDLVLIAHLGMSGRFRLFNGAAPPPDAHDHVLLTTDAGDMLRFHDPRRFGFMDLCRESEIECHPMLVSLGPEPLSSAFDGAYLAARLAGRRSPVKTAILDQRVVAGMGNIYASESLYRARLSPRRMATTVVGRRAARLADAIREVFTEAIDAGGSSLRDHRRPTGEVGRFQEGFAVYGRHGERCPTCAGDCPGIRHMVQSGRSTFYCARHQR